MQKVSKYFADEFPARLKKGTFPFFASGCALRFGKISLLQSILNSVQADDKYEHGKEKQNEFHASLDDGFEQDFNGLCVSC